MCQLADELELSTTAARMILKKKLQFSVCLCKHVKAVLHACSSAPKWSNPLITYITMKFKQLKKNFYF